MSDNVIDLHTKHPVAKDPLYDSRRELQALAMSLGQTAGLEAYDEAWQKNAMRVVLQGVEPDIAQQLLGEFVTLLLKLVEPRLKAGLESAAAKEAKRVARAERLRAERHRVVGPVHSLALHMESHPYALLHVGLPTRIVTVLEHKYEDVWACVRGELVCKPKPVGIGKPLAPVTRQFEEWRPDVQPHSMESLAELVQEYALQRRLTDYDAQLPDEWNVNFSYVGLVLSPTIAHWTLHQTTAHAINLEIKS